MQLVYITHTENKQLRRIYHKSKGSPRIGAETQLKTGTFDSLSTANSLLINARTFSHS